MILDERLEFADAQAITSAAGSNIIGDVIDLGIAGRDIGNGQPVYLIIQVQDTFAGGTSFQFVLASDAAAAIQTDGTETVHYRSDVFATTELVQGFTLVAPLPSGSVSTNTLDGGYERFLGVYGVGLGTHTVTAGNSTVNMFLTYDPHGWKSYADGSN